MRLTVNVSGNLSQIADDMLSSAAQAVTKAMDEAGQALREDMRSDIASAGLGNFGKALGYNSYPSLGRGASLTPAAEVYVRGRPDSKWSKALAAYAYGALNQSPNGKWLAIPTDKVPLGRNRVPISPEECVERFGPFHSIDKGRVILLLSNTIAGKSGGVRRASAGRLAQGRAVQETLMYVLVRSVRIRPRLSVDAIAAQWEGKLPGIIADALAGIE